VVLAETVEGADAVLEAELGDTVAGIDRAEDLLGIADVNLAEHPVGGDVVIE